VGASGGGAGDCLYIYLKEKNYSDTGVQDLTWRVVENTSLKDLATRFVTVGRPEYGAMKIWDTAPPRINYALTTPGTAEIYVQFSEPVVTGAVQVQSIDLTSSTGLAAPGGDENLLISLASPYALTDLVRPVLTYPMFTLEKIRDKAPFVEDYRTSGALYAYLYPSPKYPENWNYSAYVEIRGDGSGGSPFDTVPPGGTLPPIKDWGPPAVPGNRPDRGGGGTYGEDKHRVTDVLVSSPPARKDDPGFFAWPVWARHTNPPNNAAWGTGPRDTDTGIIWDFTGRKALEEQDTTLQVMRNGNLTGDLSIWYSFNVPREYRNPPEYNTSARGSSGLWLPPSSIQTFMNLVPDYYPRRYSKLFDPVSSAPANGLYIFKFWKNEPGYDSVSRLDFLLHFDGIGMPDDLFVARLDPVAAGPWYRRVRPFSYDIHDITWQRGGVTILNNVINPTRGEKTYIRYELSGGGRVTIQVFSLDGNLVKVLRRESRGTGEWTDAWDGRNSGGRVVARGMYFIRVVGPDIDEIRKVMVVK
jgi:hypothetical protein